MPPKQWLADAWAQRTPRERALALAVAGLLVLFVVMLSVRGALGTLTRLDSEIGRMQSDIVNLRYQIARRQSVEARYEMVAAQHSSAWSESEIRDRLRQEIYRLSYRRPPRLDAEGIPVTTDSEGEALVRIPELRGGHLVEGGEGYRAYQIEFDVPPAPFPDMLAYLEYLRGSPQSLRIDRIDLRRDPHRPEVAARILLTRIVVDDPRGGEARPGAVAAGRIELRPEDWTLEGCEVAIEDGDGSRALRFASETAGGRTFLTRNLPGGETYTVEVEVSSGVPARLAVAFDGAPASGDGVIEIPGDHHFYRYRFQFTAPGGAGERVSVNVPVVAWEEAENTVRVRGLRIEPSGEATRGT